MKVTVITPTFNSGNYIENCIRSITGQTHKDIECIIIDACSSDKTESIVRSYDNKLNLIYVREKDEGQADAINKGLAMATGDIVCWLNADDSYVDSQVIENIVAEFRDKNADVLYGRGYYVDPQGKRLKVITNNFNLSELKVIDPFLQPATFWRKNTIRLHKNYQYVFDWVFFMEMYQAGLKFKCIDLFVANYQVDGKNKTAQDTADRKYEVFEVVKIHSGLFSPNTYWCYLIYLLYRFIEWGQLPFAAKKLLQYVNTFIYFLSFKKVCSC